MIRKSELNLRPPPLAMENVSRASFVISLVTECATARSALAFLDAGATIVQMNDSETDDHCHPVVNVEETIGKTVGRRVPLNPSKVQEIGQQIYRSRKFRVCPKGVYRFHSHEEANQWMMKMTVERAIKADAETS
jgi:hypothetical protein